MRGYREKGGRGGDYRARAKGFMERERRVYVERRG